VNSLDLEISAGLRDNVHNLDLNDPKDKALYDSYRAAFITHLEGTHAWAYDDKNNERIRPDGPPPKGNVTVGVGFNMDAKNVARKAWNKVFGDSVSFDDVKAGRTKLNPEQIERLLDYSLTEREKELKKAYKSFWRRLAPNERLAIESAYFNGPALVKPGSDFYKHIEGFFDSKQPIKERVKHFEAALHQLRALSNKNKVSGLSDRHEKEAEMLDTRKCPFMRPPGDLLNEAAEKDRTDPLYLKQTVLPRIVDSWQKPDMKDSRFFIWRSMGDSRVRLTHQWRNGKIFCKKTTPLPQDEPNCRCTAVPLPYVFAKRIERIKVETKIHNFPHHLMATQQLIEDDIVLERLEAQHALKRHGVNMLRRI
jgi:hypothetical protein